MVPQKASKDEGSVKQAIATLASTIINETPL